MIKNTKKFLIASFAFLIVLCIVIFSFISVFMGRKSDAAISEIGMIYMSEMNEQLQEKFSTVIDLRLLQAEGIIKRTPPDTFSYGEEMLEELAISARVREFTYLGLYEENGNHETIYGEDVEPIDGDEFAKALKSSEINVTSGINESGEKLILLVQCVEYEMKDGNTSIAMVAGFPMDYLNEALFLDEDDALVYSHIIRRDGSYVVRSGEAYRDNYFERMLAVWSGIKGEEPEAYVKELQKAMADNEDYSALIMADGAHRHVY